MDITSLIRFADTIAPAALAEDWDNVGLLVPPEDGGIEKALLALDITPDVVREARELGAQLIISHHPVIFETFRTLEPGTAPYLLARYGIGALCLHTNLDRAEKGVNICLAEALGLGKTVFDPENYIVVGEPPYEMSADEFAAYIKEKLGAPSVRYTSGRVTRAAVSSGAGGGAVELHAEKGFDAFVTGEIKHHCFTYAQANGIAAFDAGHFSTENVVIKPLRDMFAERFPEVTFVISESCACPYAGV